MSDADRLSAYDRELSAVMPADFKDWWQNSPDEWPIVARRVIEGLRERAEWNAANAPADPALLALASAVREWAQWVGAVHVGSPEHKLFLMAKEQGLIDA